VFNALEHRYHYSCDQSDEKQKQGAKALIVWCKGGYLSLILSGFELLHQKVSPLIVTPTVPSTQLSSTAPNATFIHPSINKRKQLRGSGSADPVIYLSIRLYLNAAHQSKSVHMRLSFPNQPILSTFACSYSNMCFAPFH
jgi:hypothetical protein